MLSLIKSQRFQEDYKRFRTEIDAVTDEKTKSNLELLLSKLVAEVKQLDVQHNNLVLNKTASISDDSKIKITEIRRQLDSILRDWKEVKQTQD